MRQVTKYMPGGTKIVSHRDDSGAVAWTDVYQSGSKLGWVAPSREGSGWVDDAGNSYPNAAMAGCAVAMREEG